MTESSESSVSRAGMLELGLTLATIVVVPGVANYVLGAAGYNVVGSLVWAVGYGSGAIFIWYRWVRPLDISAPESASRADPESEE